MLTDEVSQIQEVSAWQIFDLATIHKLQGVYLCEVYDTDVA